MQRRLGSRRVSSSWQLWTDDPDERRRFADLATTLAHPGEPAGPRNRLRHVLRVEGKDATWYLKVFTATQWKNRLHFRCTQPRARNDAERELRVTQALRAAGHGAPVPVAYGTDGPRSFYVCRALPGRAFTEHLADGSADAGMASAVARHCGALLRAGFRLPDLSADHVFLTAAASGWHCAVLDLHNGGLGRAATPPHRLLVRVLRRFARSVRHLPVRWPAALRFAVRLLEAAGARAHARAVLRALPPFTTAARYEVGGKSAAYAARNPRRDAREQALLARLWPGRPGESVLDLPCGAGRLLPLLQARGHRVFHADGALAMLREARAAAAAHGDAAPPAVAADALAMPFADRTIDGVVMFRFLHHLPPEHRGAAIAEACRVARRFLVLSFFHPCSFHHLQRRLGQLAGNPPVRFAVRLATLRRELERHGFALQATAADLPFARDLWLASFVRR